MSRAGSIGGSGRSSPKTDRSGPANQFSVKSPVAFQGRHLEKMSVLSRDKAKSILQKGGFFPAARAVYRLMNGDIRRQRRRELNFYSTLLKPDALCFDVGANLGQKTEIFLACGARVITIEPNRHCRPTLEFHFGRNPRCELLFTAVGSSESTIELFTHLADSTASVRPDWDKKVFGVPREMNASLVPMTTLDTLIKRHGRPDFIKIDVEGFETEVLRGLSTPIALLSFEYHVAEIERTRECLAMLGRMGNITVRASDMHCNWLGPETDGAGCLRLIQARNASGDLFVRIG
jgi:FkbM family methyltransferase